MISFKMQNIYWPFKTAKELLYSLQIFKNLVLRGPQLERYIQTIVVWGTCGLRPHVPQMI